MPGLIPLQFFSHLNRSAFFFATQPYKIMSTIRARRRIFTLFMSQCSIVKEEGESLHYTQRTLSLPNANSM
jgi:hypothetical protein